MRVRQGRRKNIPNETNRGWFERRKWEERFHHLSHPFPLVVIDRVAELERGKRIRTKKWVTANEFYLAGHFPGEPILPGVLTLEGLVQSALILLDDAHPRGKLVCALEKVDRLKFKRPVLPGDTVDFQVNLTGQEEHVWKFKGKALVGEETAAEGDLFFRVTVTEMGFDL